MFVIPAIDLKNGKIVRLTQGDFDKVEEYKLDPVETARYFAICGAKWIHVVDLYGALKGHFRLKNLDALKKIVQEVRRYGTSVQFGGGVRCLDDIDKIIYFGASRVIVGTLTQENINFVKKAVKKYGDKFVVSLDAKNSILYKRGWSKASKIEMSVFLKDLEDCGVKLLIYTNIAKDGMLKGVDIKGIENILSLTKIPVVASGGVSDLEDMKKLKQLENKGLCGVIVGKAIYKGRIDLKEAINYVS